MNHKPNDPPAPNGGYLRIAHRLAQVTERELVSDSARGQIADYASLVAVWVVPHSSAQIIHFAAV